MSIEHHVLQIFPATSGRPLTVGESVRQFGLRPTMLLPAAATLPPRRGRPRVRGRARPPHAAGTTAMPDTSLDSQMAEQRPLRPCGRTSIVPAAG